MRKEERVNGNEEGAGEMTRQMLMPPILGGGRGAGGGGAGGGDGVCTYVYIHTYSDISMLYLVDMRMYVQMYLTLH